MLFLEQAAKKYLNDYIYDCYKGIVMIGPFKGMKILKEMAWFDGNLGTKVLGCYEQELHEFIEDEINYLKKLGRPPIILDIGCSEGYYAVGMALRIPGAKVVAVDSSDEALRITQLAAKANDVVIETLKDCPYDIKPDFVICDCEGGEMVYLDPDKFPGLRDATILVECHDMENTPATKTMGDRFKVTHNVWILFEGGRNPNQFDILGEFDSLMRWLAVSEGRPCIMHWLQMRVK